MVESKDENPKKTLILDSGETEPQDNGQQQVPTLYKSVSTTAIETP